MGVVWIRHAAKHICIFGFYKIGLGESRINHSQSRSCCHASTRLPERVDRNCRGGAAKRSAYTAREGGRGTRGRRGEIIPEYTCFRIYPRSDIPSMLNNLIANANCLFFLLRLLGRTSESSDFNIHTNIAIIAYLLHQR